MKPPTPTHRETVALFRLGVVGDLLAMDLEPGELQDELVRRSQRRYRAPGSSRTRRYHWKTLQRWYYAAKAAEPGALEPASRARGFALALTAEQRTMLLEMRSANRSAAASLILDQAVANGIVAKDQVSVSTIRRLFADAGLPRLSRKRAQRADTQRRRWQAAKPGDLWHGDVCHLVFPDGDGRRKVLVHGMMDDHSRFFTALKGRAAEREQDMLEVFCGALLRYPTPKALYLDYVARNIIVVLWPVFICGQPLPRGQPGRCAPRNWPHMRASPQSSSSHVMRSSSPRHDGASSSTLVVGGSQARRAASLARALISA
jgi:hypothetical protein